MNMSSSEYLDQIAPKAPKKQGFGFNLRTMIFAGIGAVILVIIIAVISSSISGNKMTPWYQLSLRLAATEEIANQSTKSLKSSALRSINSDVKITLTNTERDLAPVFERMKITPKKIPASIQKTETVKKTEMLTRLETGRLNAKYDSTYAREMGYQLATVLALYQALYSQSGPATKETLKASYDNLLPAQKTVSEFNSATE